MIYRYSIYAHMCTVHNNICTHLFSGAIASFLSPAKHFKMFLRAGKMLRDRKELGE